MARSNGAAAEALQEFAHLVSISGGDPYRVRAYQKAARAVAGYPVNIIGHPTTHSLGRRPPIDFDVDAVFAAAARTGTAPPRGSTRSLIGST